MFVTITINNPGYSINESNQLTMKLEGEAVGLRVRRLIGKELTAALLHPCSAAETGHRRRQVAARALELVGEKFKLESVTIRCRDCDHEVGLQVSSPIGSAEYYAARELGIALVSRF